MAPGGRPQLLPYVPTLVASIRSLLHSFLGVYFPVQFAVQNNTQVSDGFDFILTREQNEVYLIVIYIETTVRSPS